jgi:hypothetical protein
MNVDVRDPDGPVIATLRPTCFSIFGASPQIGSSEPARRPSGIPEKLRSVGERVAIMPDLAGTKMRVGKDRAGAHPLASWRERHVNASCRSGSPRVGLT